MRSSKFVSGRLAIARFLAFCFIAPLLVGCSDQLHDVLGKVVRDGKPIARQARQVMKVGLRRSDSGSADQSQVAALYTATVNIDGTFKLSSVAPGKYHLLVSDFLAYPSNDQLAAYFRKNPQQFEVVVPMSDEEELVIDIESRWYKRDSR
jgi:hypothetical protein